MTPTTPPQPNNADSLVSIPENGGMSVTIEALEAARDTLNFTAKTLREHFTAENLSIEVWQIIQRAEEDSHGCKIALFDLGAVDSPKPDFLDYLDRKNDACEGFNDIAGASLMTVLQRFGIDI